MPKLRQFRAMLTLESVDPTTGGLRDERSVVVRLAYWMNKVGDKGFAISSPISTEAGIDAFVASMKEDLDYLAVSAKATLRGENMSSD